MMINQNIKLGGDRDPAGTLFLSEGKVLRGIRNEFQDYFSKTLGSQPVQSMLGKEIVDTWKTGAQLDDFPLVLEHKRIEILSYCYEWPMQMLQDAAVLTLDICIKLNEIGSVLKDATPWNILFDGPNPVLVDFPSIMPQEKDLLWVAYDQFCRMFLFPLLVGYKTSGRTTRAMLQYSAGGITYEEVYKFLPGSLRLKFPWLVNRLDMPKVMIDMLRRTGQDKELERLKQKESYTPANRAAFFESLKKDVLSIPLRPARVIGRLTTTISTPFLLQRSSMRNSALWLNCWSAAGQRQSWISAVTRAAMRSWRRTRARM